jgi:hypothetical protein
LPVDREGDEDEDDGAKEEEGGIALHGREGVEKEKGLQRPTKKRTVFLFCSSSQEKDQQPMPKNFSHFNTMSKGDARKFCLILIETGRRFSHG